MRTTIELPDELYRQTKARAALSGLTLKELVTYWVARGLQTSDDPGHPARHRPRFLPTIVAPCGRKMPVLANADIEVLLGLEDAEAGHDADF